MTKHFAGPSYVNVLKIPEYKTKILAGSKCRRMHSRLDGHTYTCTDIVHNNYIPTFGSTRTEKISSVNSGTDMDFNDETEGCKNIIYFVHKSRAIFSKRII